MRDIIFRGKVDDENKEWVEGSLLKVEHIIHGEKYYIADLLGNSVRVLPDTVGQYTGLCDKNRKQIFEGDIVENTDDLYVVEWSEDDAKFSLVEYGSVQADFDNFWEHELEVVGNIHENKELLEESE